MVLSFRVSRELRDELEQLAAENTRTLAHQLEHVIKLGLCVIRELNGVDDIKYVIQRITGRNQRPRN